MGEEVKEEKNKGQERIYREKEGRDERKRKRATKKRREYVYMHTFLRS